MSLKLDPVYVLDKYSCTHVENFPKVFSNQFSIERLIVQSWQQCRMDVLIYCSI